MKEEVEKTSALIKEGKTIAFPTDTIWGIGCDATNPEAVAKIFDIKERDESKALVVLIADIGQLWDFVNEIPEIAWDIVEFAERPLTVVYSKAKNLAPKVMAEDGSVAIRLVQDEFCKKLIQRCRKPLIATSANISGKPNPGSFKEIDAAILSKVDYVVNWRLNEKLNNPPSRIIRLEKNGEIKFLRK